MNINTKIEKAVLRAMLDEMSKAGYIAVQVYDGGDYVPVDSYAAVEEAVFSVDTSTVHFAKTDNRKEWGRRGVFFVCGNGEDCLSDWHTGDKQFDEVMDRVVKRIDALTVTVTA